MAHAESPRVESFTRHPDSYRHWRLAVDGTVATLTMDVDEKASLGGQHELVLNSYDLGVDIELADAIQRLRFEHPGVRVLVIDSAKDRVFCAGANIRMLASSTHAFKVNFCKFTNETRCHLEDASETAGLKSLAALRGTASGGGYELALACDRILLVDDRSSAVSFPETPLLAVLPGTGGLTRVVDKRKVRRDRADFFSTTAEGLKGKRALEWGFVDALAPLSRWDEAVAEAARGLADAAPGDRPAEGIRLDPVEPEVEGDAWRYRHLDVVLDRDERTATLTLRLPEQGGPDDAAAIRALGASWWPLRAFRELDDAILRLRVNEPEIGTWILRTEGALDAALAMDATLEALASDWLVGETRHLIRRTLKRLENSSRSLIALIETGSAFGGTLLELALLADRVYMLDDPDGLVEVAISPLNGGAYPMANGLSRLETRFLGEPERPAELLARQGERMDTPEADAMGLVTDAPDDLDWEDTVRIAIEERRSLSPDALTGMEQNLRFAGPETLETKIFGRLSAWQNWIFQRPNAVGDEGALTLYGDPKRPQFDWRRT
ncbi:MAG: benzoyl-CoA-dihydrodiol lyase [Deltaproteobacteria bacterium]|nr:benzoyl-CoA-dihydrodiol lyase [Deltaproteobacteria bacterium]MCB9785737.1 benzoyl-CoA-dihydrodiol lyase [Deltaproteobacteria bacterium]